MWLDISAMYNLVLSKALIDMQPLHTLQHVLYVKPCIGPGHTLAAPAFVPQAASRHVCMAYHGRNNTFRLTKPENHPLKLTPAQLSMLHFVLHIYTIHPCVTSAHLKTYK